MTEPNWALARKREKLEERARIIAAIRAFFVAHGYLEVETPQRIPANAPEPHIDPVASDGWVLQTSPEIAMKRLLAAGYERIFQLCRVWRGGESGRHHLPEFTLLEWYRAGVDYHTLMDECEELFGRLVPGGSLNRAAHTIDLAPPWERLSVADAFDHFAPVSLEQALAEDRFEEVLCESVEPQLGRSKPTFLIEYPAAMAALARLKPGDAKVAERFELYIDGLELANAFSELIDPVEQRRRFSAAEAARRAAGKPPYPLPERFLAELAGMPPAAGIALGIDRLVMLLSGVATVDETVAFPPHML
jgi:lysyl-tRNA synthetase class 2